MPEKAPIRTALISWERLRLVFNLILLIEGLALSSNLIPYFGGVGPWAFWIVVFGLTANAWFSFGPLLEIYWIIFRGGAFGRIRYGMFGLMLVGGMLVVLYLAAMTLLASGNIFNQ